MQTSLSVHNTTISGLDFFYTDLLGFLNVTEVAHGNAAAEVVQLLHGHFCRPPDFRGSGPHQSPFPN